MTTKAKVLVVEDEPAIRRGMADALRFARYEVEEAADGISGLDRALAPGLDMLLLDLMLPGKDGFEVLEEVRKARPRLPVIIITARGSEDDRVRGLSLGADDYVVKPFSARELMARVEAVLRRSAERPIPSGPLRLERATVDFERREIVLDGGARAELSPREADLLAYLAANRGRAVSRREILERVWGIDAEGLDTRAVDMLVARLRAKLGPPGAAAVLTVRGSGYALGGPE